MTDVATILYSGSHEPFTSFCDCSYLTPDREIASQYGKHVVAATAELHNSLRAESLRDICDACGIDPLDESRFVFEELDRKIVRNAIRQAGYDAVEFIDVAPNSPGDKTHIAVIVFDGSLIKLA